MQELKQAIAGGTVIIAMADILNEDSPTGPYFISLDDLQNWCNCFRLQYELLENNTKVKIWPL